jgi:hypothetical protein
MPEFTASLDLNQQEMRNAVSENLDVPPLTPVVGQRYYDTVLGIERYWNGLNWVDLSGGSGGTQPLGALAYLDVVTSTEIADGTITDVDIDAAAAIALSKLAVDPLDRANHTGTQTASTISDFDLQVRTNSVDELALPTTPVSFNGQQLLALADPTSDTGAATKSYVDAVAKGLDFKDSVRIGVDVDIDLNAPGTTLDGVTMATDDRILVFGQLDGTQNGIYTYTDPTTPLVRSLDADEDSEVTAGMFAFVTEGTHANHGYVLTTPDPITVGTSVLDFTTMSASGGGGVPPSLWAANTIVKADQDATPIPLVVPPSTFVGRAATGAIASLNSSAAKAVLDIATTDVAGLGALATHDNITSAEIADGTIKDVDISATAAIALSKLAVDPLARANHTGTQLAATISDFDAAVRLNRLDQMAAPTGPVGFANQHITNVAPPVVGTDAATKTYVDSTIGAGSGMPASLYDANSVVVADIDDTPRVQTLGPSTFLGRSSTGNITALVLGALASKNTVADTDVSATAAIALSKLAVDPLARANHTGTQLAVTISDFNTAVRTNRLDQMAVPTAPVSLGSQRLTNLATPTTVTDAATMAYVDGKAGGVDPTLYDANSTLVADTDNTPRVQVLTANTVLGRGAAGAITALAYGALAAKNQVATADIAPGAVDNSTISATAGIALSKLAVDPLARANHTGTQLAVTVSDFNAAVRLNRLDQMATPTASVALGAQTITGLGAPTNPTDAATKAYVDGAAGGISANLYDAFTVLRADVDNTPTALLVNPSTFVGRAATGGIVALDTTTAKATLAITATDVAGLGTLATKSTITSAEITDGTIANADIAPGAAIDMTKLSVNPLARANHTGTQLAVTVSDFDTQVRTSRLDQMAKPTVVVDANGQRITGVATPTGATDATNKTYVDNVAAGLDFKQSVKACATVNVSLAAPGVTIDGVTMASGNRVLLTGQTTATDNGIWVWNGAAAAMTRATDADVDAEVTSGMYVFVESGTANGAKAFVLTTPDPIVLGTTPLTFILFSGGGTSVVGTANRITVTGPQIDISTAYAGQATIATVGTITTGEWAVISGTNTTRIGYQAGIGGGGEGAYFGYQAGGTTNAGYNTCIGSRSGTSLSGNTHNTHVGYSTTGGDAGGSTALGSLSYATYNYSTALGYKASAQNTGSVAIGCDSAGNPASTIVQDEIKLGTALHKVNILGTLTVGGVAVGGAGGSPTVATANTRLGFQAGNALSGASNNTMVGDQTGKAVTSGSNNTMLGMSAGLVATVAGNNTFIGYQTGKALINGTLNTFVGYNAGLANNATENTCVGSSAGATNQGSSSVFVGSTADSTAGAVSDGAITAVGYGSRGGSVGATAIGCQALTGGQYATALGTSANAATTNATALGRAATASANQAVAVGYLAGSGGNYALALGANASAGGGGSVAIGTDNTGAGANTSTANEIMLGTALHTVNISGALKVAGLAVGGVTPITGGGTGATTAAAARANLGITGAKFTARIGNASLTSFTVTHNLNTTDVLVEIYDTATGATVYADVVRTNVNVVTVSGFHTVPTTNQYSVVVFG